MTSAWRCLVAFLTAMFSLYIAVPAHASAAGESVVPLSQAHAHNDYEHDRPLLDALSHGFTSVEADVWLVDDDLLIGHDAPVPGRTLRSTYLEPMRQRVAQHGGSMYPGWDGTFQLLLDVKSGAHTWYEIERQLAEFPDVFTSYQAGVTTEKAALAVISGNRNLMAMLWADGDDNVRRWSGFDGRWINTGGSLKSDFMPLVSSNWQLIYSWRGEGDMPAWQRRQLRDYVDHVHSLGAKVRFWGTPDEPGPARDAVWAELLAAGVDYINTDDLAGLEEFLRRIE